ncbi:MAG TPA: TMEM175 family protein [Candidatus Limnocylindria bacterium]
MTARSEAFSDAIFAIAMTLLVLEIKVPVGETSLSGALARQWPSFAAFAVTFLYIGVYWMSHHATSRLVVRSDGWLLLLNLLFLMTISFVPYPTALLADRLQTGHELNLATAFYGASMLLPALLSNALWLYISRGRRLLTPTLGDAQVAALTRSYLLGPVLYAISVVVALFVPVIALVFYVLGPSYYAVVSARSSFEQANATAA